MKANYNWRFDKLQVDFIQLRASYTKVDLSQFSTIESVILIKVVYTIIIKANTD